MRLRRLGSLIQFRAASANATRSADPAVFQKRRKTFKPPTPPTGVKAPKLLFPLSLKDSVQQWLSRPNLALAEAELFKFGKVDVQDDPAVSSIDTKIAPKSFINELQIVGPRVGNQENKHIVLIHGYGAAKGFFYRNFAAIGGIPGYTLHALDLLGYGRSTRPKFRITAKDPKDGVNQAEGFFIDSLEEWRKARGIDSFAFMAHSLGAYVGAGYAIRFPERVSKMMFISPAGVNRTLSSIPADVLGSGEDVYDASNDTPLQIPGWFQWLWERNVSPFSLIRNTGPFGPMVTSGWSYRRFKNLEEGEQKALHLYTYATFRARGSGEYALNYLLAPGAHGRWPLSERVKGLRCPSLWLYGDSDWMDIRGGYEAERQIKKHTDQPVQVLEVPNAGHHLYLDNEGTFNKLAIDFVTKFGEKKLTDATVESAKEATTKLAPVAQPDGVPTV